MSWNFQLIHPVIKDLSDDYIFQTNLDPNFDDIR